MLPEQCICSKVSSLVGVMFVTDCVRSTREGYVLTRVCPSVCPQVGGYLARSRRGTPWPGPGGGYPAGGTLRGVQPGPGGVGYLGTPQSGPDVGYSARGYSS